MRRLFRVANGNGMEMTTGSLTARRISVPYTSRFHKERGMVNTLKITTDDGVSKPPLVLIHGYGAAMGFFVANFEELSRHFDVFAVDLPLFGRSSRHEVSFREESSHEAADYFTEALFEWKKNVGLVGPVHLAGHSFGGYLAASFALKYGPEHVNNLMLLDSWGLAERKAPAQGTSQSFAYKTVSFLSTKISPLSLMRIGGEAFGKALVRRFRKDIFEKFVPIFGVDDAEIIVSDYIYHSNSKPSAAEDAFRVMSVPIAYAKHPLENSLYKLDPSIKLTFLYGEHTWIDPRPGARVAASRKNTRLRMIPNASHHIYIDNVDAFNREVVMSKN